MKPLLIKLFEGFTVDCRFLDKQPFINLPIFCVYIPFYDYLGIRTNDYQRAFYGILSVAGGRGHNIILHVYWHGQEVKPSNLFF
mgnify:CR=1 FL=1